MLSTWCRFSATACARTPFNCVSCCALQCTARLIAEIMGLAHQALPTAKHTIPCVAAVDARPERGTGGATSASPHSNIEVSTFSKLV